MRDRVDLERADQAVRYLRQARSMGGVLRKLVLNLLLAIGGLAAGVALLATFVYVTEGAKSSQLFLYSLLISLIALPLPLAWIKRNLTRLATLRAGIVERPSEPGAARPSWQERAKTDLLPWLVWFFPLGAFWASLFIVASILGPLRRPIWPGAPPWMPDLLWIALFLALFPGWKWLRSRRALFPEQKSSLLSDMTVRMGFMLAGTFFLFFLLITIESSLVGRLENLPEFMVLLGSLLWLAYLLSGSVAPLNLWLTRAARRTDHSTVLDGLDHARRWHSFARGAYQPELHSLRGKTLLQAGCCEEAEGVLREALLMFEQEPDPHHRRRQQGITLEILGQALLGQGRYAEALHALEDAVQANPDRSTPYNSLAEFYLRQGTEPERALQLVNRALEYQQRSWLGKHLASEALATIWANRAWAQALLEQPEDAAASLAEAFGSVGSSNLLGLAIVHERAGQAQRALKRDEQAREHFQRVQTLDPTGYLGQLAARVLREIGE